MATSRADRDLHRGRRAASRVCADGGSALAAACAHIEATFSSAMRHSMFKDRVAAVMKDGIANPAMSLRYGRLIERHAVTSLDAAIVLVERMRRAEREARAAAGRNWGHCSRPRSALMILNELRLILRMQRRYAPAHFSDLIAAVQAHEAATQGRARDRVDAAE